MDLGAGRTIGLVILWAASAAPANSQISGGHHASPQSPPSSPAQIAAARHAAVEAVREIDDPHNGDRWLLVRGRSDPAGPGSLILANTGFAESRQMGRESAPPAASRQMICPAALPAIHTGDRLIVEEHTALVEGRLEAVALGPALVGSPLKVRLAVGGKVVRAVALGPGRAEFAPATEARP